MQQFHRPANLYFLVISALQCTSELTTSNWGTTLIPLLFVLVLNGLKEAYDEQRRRTSDQKVPSHFCLLPSAVSWLNISSCNSSPPSFADLLNWLRIADKQTRSWGFDRWQDSLHKVEGCCGWRHFEGECRGGVPCWFGVHIFIWPTR